VQSRDSAKSENDQQIRKRERQTAAGDKAHQKCSEVAVILELSDFPGIADQKKDRGDRNGYEEEGINGIADLNADLNHLHI
jgi:hypothetical protein